MSKKKKNGNYVTPKTEAAKAQKLREEKKKKIMKIVKASIIVFAALAVIAGIILGIGFGYGLFEYRPEVTHHASIEIAGYGTVNVELYGKEAQKTVENFVNRVDAGYYNGKSFSKLVGDAMYVGEYTNMDTFYAIESEFYNGTTNRISHARGTLSMARSSRENYSAYGQFFIARKNMRELDGQYAAFGRVTTGMKIIDKIYKDMEKNPETPIIITKITEHSH